MKHVNRKAYLDPQHRLAIRNEEIPRPKDDEVLVEIRANGICGSDIHFYKEGRLGNFVVDRPYVPGHECSGVAVAVGSSVSTVKVGTPVVIEPGIPCGLCAHCKSGRYNLCPRVVFLSAPPVDGTFCDYIAVRADMVFPVPEGLSFEKAAMVEPVAVAVHAVNRGRFKRGADALVVGAGPIGLLTAQAAKAAGAARVCCVDLNERRLETARRLGIDRVALPSDAGLEGSADVVFETAGARSVTAATFRYCRTGGCVVQVGWPGGNIVEMDIAMFLDKELDYVGVNRYANAFPAAIDWIVSGKIDVEALITSRFPFDRIAEAFAYTAENPDKAIKTIVVNRTAYAVKTA